MTKQISAQSIKELREKTGAGMMDCKKALQECSGDMNKALEELRKKGLAYAEKKIGRKTAEGIIESYIHIGGRIGVLVEINCETDFVAKREEFQQMARNIAMQLAASPNVEYVQISDIPKEIIEKEKEIESQREDIKDKPEKIKTQIVEGRIHKRLKELSLLDQEYIRDPNITVEELIKQNIATIGENIQVKRFVKFLLGENTNNEDDKRNNNFQYEVQKMLQS
uniref:Elongation factor Ts, mitochondrial n=1 Tax=Sciadococcus taiwanensis TaxID=3028030 RepID=A0A9Y1I264_9RHOD|nr:elongation factor Ts [Sciadococcus taiwanensis]